MTAPVLTAADDETNRQLFSEVLEEGPISCSGWKRQRGIGDLAGSLASPAGWHLSCAPLPIEVGEMQILIVDDDKTFCQFLAELLRDKGYAVDWTSHGLEGYKMSQRKLYDLFVLDVRMPFLLGTELAEGLREQSPNTKIILISAFADELLRNTAKSLGVPLLSKPFTTESFLDVVAETTRP